MFSHFGLTYIVSNARKIIQHIILSRIACTAEKCLDRSLSIGDNQIKDCIYSQIIKSMKDVQSFHVECPFNLAESNVRNTQF